MRFDVPDSFVEVVRQVDKEIIPKNVIEALKWASENPDKARLVAEGWSKLGKYGRSEFNAYLVVYDPEYALKTAHDREARLRERRRLIGKAIAHAKKGGYKFTMPNGVECAIMYDVEDVYSPYHFNFNVAGQTITLAYCKIVGYAIEETLAGEPSLSYLRKIIYREKTYELSSVYNVFLKAIKMNVLPEVMATVEP